MQVKKYTYFSNLYPKFKICKQVEPYKRSFKKFINLAVSQFCERLVSKINIFEKSQFLGLNIM